MTTCHKCLEDKEDSEFPQCKGKRHGRTCNSCAKLRVQKWYRETDKVKLRARQRAYQLRINYGIGPEDEQKLLHEQQGCCAICKKDLPPGKRNVDHDHSTGKVRGILCNNCNRGIGHLQDSVIILENAISYLSKHGAPMEGRTR